MTLKAIILDMDEALVNSEPDGHLKAFNECIVIEGLEISFQSIFESSITIHSLHTLGFLSCLILARFSSI